MKPVLLPKKQKSIAELKKTAQEHFNKFIRLRDAGQPCICCGQFRTLQAGHFYSAGKYNSMRFNEDNVHGCCLQCNYFLSGNLLEYRKNLEKKIGIERLKHLDFLAGVAKRERSCKYDRYTLELKIQEYKAKNKKVG